jgi:hypothetical protein
MSAFGGKADIMNDGDQIGHFGSMVTHSAKIAETKGSLLALAFLALVVGAAAGLVGVIFQTRPSQGRCLYLKNWCKGLSIESPSQH